LDKVEEESAIRGCQAGNKEAFRVLAEEYERKLFGIAYLMTHDRELAADMVQEALLKMWQHIPSLRDRKGLKPWLIRILVNQVRQQNRKKQVPTIVIEEVPDVAGDSTETDMDLEQDDIRKNVRHAVGMLPANQREAVILRYFGDLTVAEVALTLGCRKGTVKSRLSRALDQLEAILKDSGIREVMD
jgi:RNA polymerase sigma-70 factor (ECF subfamily)